MISRAAAAPAATCQRQYDVQVPYGDRESRWDSACFWRPFGAAQDKGYIMSTTKVCLAASTTAKEPIVIQFS